MRRLVAYVAGIVLGVLVALVAAGYVGARRFEMLAWAEKSDMRRAAVTLPAAGEKGKKRSSLPAPVRRYIEVAGVGDKGLRIAQVRQRGTIRISPDKSWIDFKAEQVFSFEPPGFVWTAKAKIAPLFPMFVRDKFAQGRGYMLVKLLGLITVADATGPGMDFSAGVRFWAEALAFPESLRSPYLSWEAVDDMQARMLVRQPGQDIEGLVVFGEKGWPAAIHAQRYRDVEGIQVLTPWSGYFREWREIDGRMFPAKWESVWRLPEGDFLAVRIENLNILTH